MSYPRPRSVGVAQWTGFGGAAALAIITSGIAPPMVALTLGLVAMGTVIGAWIRIGRHIGHVTTCRLYAIAAIWCTPLALARPLFSGDIYSYLAQGVIAARGLDPYRLGPARALGPHAAVTEHVSHDWRTTPAPYGPAFLAVSRTIARHVGDDVRGTLIAHRCVELVGVVLIAWALPRLARRAGGDPATALWLGLLNPLLLWHIVAGSHNDGLMLGLVLVGTELALDGRVLGQATGYAHLCAGVMLLTIATNIKIVALAAVCCVIVAVGRPSDGTARRGPTMALVVAVGCVSVTMAISIGTGFGFGWIGALGVPGKVHSWLAPTNQVGFLIGGLGSWFGLHLTAVAITIAMRVGAVLGAVLAARLLWRMWCGRIHPVRGLGFLFATMLATGPVVQPWYLLWMILPLATVACTSRDHRILIGLTALAAVVIPPVTVGSVGAFAAGYVTALVMIGSAISTKVLNDPRLRVTARLMIMDDQPVLLQSAGRSPSIKVRLNGRRGETGTRWERRLSLGGGRIRHSTGSMESDWIE